MPETAPRPAPHERAEGERRHLTVLFCDLVGSTEIASRLDPEEWRDTVAAYHRVATAAVNRFGGRVGKYLGDGVMAYFGWPEAHDNDAERAVRAGLAIVAGLAELNARAAHRQLSARIGIHSGSVVIDTGAGNEADVFGETPNVAARVQAAAERDAVFISAETELLIPGLFELEDRGVQPLKGIERRVPLYRVLRSSGARGRLQAAATTRGLAPFVGREDELHTLRTRWERVSGGEGQVVLIVGEAGIGKSRLVQQFREQIADSPHIWLESAAAPFFQNTPFYAIAELVRQGFHGEPRRASLEASFRRARINAEEAVDLLAPLLGLRIDGSHSPQTLSPQQRKRLLSLLVAWTLGIARAQPLVLVIEDLHWADPSTLEVIQLLVEQELTAPLLLLYTARPEFRSLWPLRTHHTQFILNRLSSSDVRSLVGKIVAQKALANETIATVVERTDGIPLFVEELTRAVLDSGSFRLSAGEIPATLHDSLMARLDRLGPAKKLAQLSAVLGTEFSYQLLHAVEPMEEEDLEGGLRDLADAELVNVQGIPPEATYHFRHSLIRDAAYQSLLKSTRQTYHTQIAQVLEKHFADAVETQPELLAHHYTEAVLRAQALPYWQKAGERAIQRSAYAEAISHLKRGLEALEALPDTPERVQQELSLQLTLGMALSATQGYAAPEIASVYGRAQHLCQQMGETPRLIPALLGLWRFYLLRAELSKARELAERCLTLVERVKDPARLIIAHDTVGETLYFMGDYARARVYLEQAASQHDPSKRPSRSLMDPGVSSLLLLGGTLWLLGYPDQGIEKSNEAVRLAEALEQRHNLASALVFNAFVHHMRRDIAKMRQRAEAAVKLARDEGFPSWLAEATIFVGWANAAEGHAREGLAQLQEGLTNRQAIGLELTQPLYLGMVAETYARLSQPLEGLDALADAIGRADRTGDRWWQADLLRLRGELTLTAYPENQAEAEAWFQRALALARQQQAKSFELRAAMSLSRLWRQHGRKSDAQHLVADVYNWFSEGFDTPDLLEAKSLLAELD